jgi:glycosyltransferase involved in cell wall biosynthesis
MVVSHDQHHVADALSRILTDEELRRHLRAGCAKVTLDLGWGEPVREMERLYARCVSGMAGHGETGEPV